jgi:tRNA(fMet)-specific endonuclease VapC
MTRRYLLDSGPAFDYLFKRKGVDARIAALRQKGCKVGICVPVLGEIVGGLKASGSKDSSWKIARPRLAKLICWPYEKAAAYVYGQIFAELKKSGRVIQQIDKQVAAIALTLGNCTVVSYDGDLKAIPGLPVED